MDFKKFRKELIKSLKEIKGWKADKGRGRLVHYKTGLFTKPPDYQDNGKYQNLFLEKGFNTFVVCTIPCKLVTRAWETLNEIERQANVSDFLSGITKDHFSPTTRQD